MYYMIFVTVKLYIDIGVLLHTNTGNLYDMVLEAWQISRRKKIQKHKELEKLYKTLSKVGQNLPSFFRT